MDPWAWTLSSTLVVIGWAVTLAPTITGWVITARKDRKAAENAARKRDEDAARDRETIDTLKAQLRAAQESASALREQVEQLREANRIASESDPTETDPLGMAQWVKGSVFSITNLSKREITVLSVEPDESSPFFMMDDATFPLALRRNESIRFMKALSGQVMIKWKWGCADSKSKIMESKRLCAKP